MPNYSIAEAKARLSELIDKAIAGEVVTITRDGKPAVELRPATVAGVRRPSPQLIKGIIARAKERPRLGENAVDLIRRMRDEREEAILSAVMAGSRAPMFSRYVGIDYSGAETPLSSLPGIRVCCANGGPPTARSAQILVATRARRMADRRTRRGRSDARGNRPRVLVSSSLFRQIRTGPELAVVPRRFPAPLAD
ncbi:MAG TPA: type II toxin-antitoxin system prevent-host-death family antitoxin [Roseiarcus sp.]|nr:type II toxin-antitoxin system prevent-host-death family antitoxin [Roseiarcus sp.]